VSSVSKITEDYEIILVEDSGPDLSWSKIINETKLNPRVTGIKLSRNFGQHYAITAGLDHVTGDWVVVMDCDLQDQPEEIINLYNKAIQGHDIVKARRVQRMDNYSKRLFSYLFYKVLSYLTGIKHDAAIANFGIYSKQVVQSICSLRESIRYFPTMVNWVGFNSTTLDITHSQRNEGESSYNFKKLVNLALDIILANSEKPIRLTIKLGLIISGLAFVFALIILSKYIFGIITVPGYSSLILSVWFFSGIILTTLGVIGLYVGKVLEGVKKRPIYIIENKIN
jgi:dolichol-phosphate mannosyltransferase